MYLFIEKFIISSLIIVFCICSVSRVSAIDVNNNSNDAQAMRLPVDNVPLYIDNTKARIQFAIEIANNKNERAQGLMYRHNFPINRAMLFVFPKTDIITMWMANTPLPLDIVFADREGRIINISYNAEPFSHKIISSFAPALYALEINAGQAKAKHLYIGQQLLHPIICGRCQK